MEADATVRARTVLARCDALAAFSEEPERLTRRYGTPALRAAQDAVAAWMLAAGMAVRRDAIGNLIGRYDGFVANARALVLGSHLDTVRDAGKYDGPLGILVALAAVERLKTRGSRLPFAVEIVAFADEEGLRFHSTYLGSRALAGTLDAATLKRRDADGIALSDAIRQFGGDPTALATCRREPADLLGYIEVHIEQGPVLEVEGLPVGLVAAIAGQSRFAVVFTGEAGHAGMVPMALRRDALCAAAEFALSVEQAACATDGLVATVGQFGVEPGASNVVPGHALLSLDIRHSSDAILEDACLILKSRARQIASRRMVMVEWQLIQAHPAVQCDPDLTAALGRAVAAGGYPVRTLVSGAGHDAVALAAIAPVAMLFVRCAGGVSHHPAEAVAAGDVAVAIETLDRALGEV